MKQLDEKLMLLIQKAAYKIGGFKWTIINQPHLTKVLEGRELEVNESIDELIKHIKEELGYESLLEDREKLNCLEACGVDNWSGYSDAMQMMNEEEE